MPWFEWINKPKQQCSQNKDQAKNNFMKEKCGYKFNCLNYSIAKSHPDRQRVERVVKKNDVRNTPGGNSSRVHCYSQIRFFKCQCIIHPIADHACKIIQI